MSAPSIVRLARIGDEPEIFDFFVLAHADNGFFPLSSKKVIDKIMHGCRNEGVSIGLIRDHQGKIEAASGMELDSYWYTDVYFLNEILNFVHPDHRRSKHAQALLKFQKDTSDIISAKFGYKVPIFPGILTRTRLEAKMRLFSREFPQVGAIYAYNAEHYMHDDQFTQKKPEFPKKLNGHSHENATRGSTLAGAA